jgi:hypothetical protein
MIKLLATLLASSGLAAPTAFGCSDEVVQRLPADVVYGHDLGCGTIQVNLNGVTVGGAKVGCPAFALITPPRDVPRSQKGSGTLTRPVGNVSVTLMTFECSTDWFLIIPVGSSCSVKGSSVVGALTTYEQILCDHVASGDSGAG